MRQRLSQLTLSSALCAALAVTAVTARADFDAGLEAFKRGDVATAVAEWQAAADRGDAESAYHLGVVYAEGRGVPQDPQRAFELLSRASDGGSRDATFALAQLYSAGIGVERDADRALELLNKAADAGQVVALFHLGMLHAEGRGVPQDPKRAFELVSRAADQGSLGATVAQAEMFMNGFGVERDQQKGLELLRKAADEKHPDALYELANLYRRGDVVGPQDYAKAAELYRAAVEGGHVGAANNLGAMYLFGQGFEQNPAEARKFFTFAAEHGLPRGMTNLGYLFEEGLGTEQDLLQAARLYRVAAELRDVEARQRLAALRSDLDAAYAAPSTQKELIRQIQLFLTTLGLEPGPADGVAGPRTVGAIREFQEKLGLPAAGEPTMQLREQLLEVLAPPLPQAQAPAQPP